MSFLTVNGLNVDAYHDNFDRTYEDIQSFVRTEGFTFEGALYSSKRAWTFEIPWEPVEVKAVGLRDWIKGRGHYWTFERVDGATTRFNQYSSEGGPSFTNVSAGSGFASLGSVWSAVVASAAAAVATTTFGNDNKWSISAWKIQTNSTWVLASIVYDGATIRYYTGPTAGVTTAFAWLTATLASGYASWSLLGKDTTGTNTTAWYDGLMIVPYAMSTTQLQARAARIAPEPAFPFVEIDGDFLEDLNPIIAKGFIEHEPMKQTGGGSNLQNSRLMKVHLIEK